MGKGVGERDPSGLDLTPNSQVTLAKLFPSPGPCFSLCQLRVGKTQINPHSQPHEVGAFVFPFYRWENRLQEVNWTTAIQLKREQGRI